jgi:hypothetical protein
MDVWEVPRSSRAGLDRGFLMDVGPTRAKVLVARMVDAIGELPPAPDVIVEASPGITTAAAGGHL